MSANAKMGFQVDDDGATRATASFDCLWLHQPPARSPRIRPLSSFSNITMPAADWTFIGPLDFLTPTEWSRRSSRMADMVRARWWDGTAASMSREVGKNDRMCFFHFFLKGMLSQAILQMAGSKRAQVDLARIILRLPKNLDNTLYQTWLVDKAPVGRHKTQRFSKIEFVAPFPKLTRKNALPELLSQLSNFRSCRRGVLAKKNANFQKKKIKKSPKTVFPSILARFQFLSPSLPRFQILAISLRLFLLLSPNRPRILSFGPSHSVFPKIKILFRIDFLIRPCQNFIKSARPKIKCPSLPPIFRIPTALSPQSMISRVKATITA